MNFVTLQSHQHQDAARRKEIEGDAVYGLQKVYAVRTYYIGTSDPPQVVEAQLKSFLDAYCINVSSLRDVLPCPHFPHSLLSL